MSEKNPSAYHTEDQKRAAQAWEDVKSIEKAGFANDYRDLARKAPALIQSSGLGQAIAFLRAKAGTDRHNAHWMVYHHVSAWVMRKLKLPTDQADLLLEWIIRQDTATYRRAMTEALAYLGWLKRFAEATLPEK
jgi:CRISPR-associated protein Cmr5